MLNETIADIAPRLCILEDGTLGIRLDDPYSDQHRDVPLLQHLIDTIELTEDGLGWVCKVKEAFDLTWRRAAVEAVPDATKLESE